MRSDPLSPSVRLRAELRRAASRVLTRLRPGRRRNVGVVAGRPFLDYRRELRGEPRGRALLSYLAEPFHHSPDVSGRNDYSNWMMSLEIANALNRVGFVVDIINYDDYQFVPAVDYDLFMGMAANFSRLLPLMSDRTKTIYWATRPDPAFEMEAIRQRQLALYRRRQQWITTSEALMPLLESADYHRADSLLLIGNQAVRSTFRTPSPNVFCIDNPALPFSLTGAPRDLSQARRNFLFLSSWLLIRKGLDVVLEAFAARPNLDLWICGPVDSEPDFMRAYRQELFHTPNIHVLGWVSMQSETFAETARRCACLVFPSCAEGMSGSVINGMAHGLVPICTPASGVDLDDFGISIADASPAGLGDTLDRVALMSEDELRRRGAAAQAAAAERYTIVNFKTQIEAAIRHSVQGP